MDEHHEDWADDFPDDGEPELLACPACGRSVYEETQQCPYCGEWIMPHAAAGATPPWARIVGAIVALALLAAVVRGLIRLF